MFETVQQQMKVDESAVRGPFPEYALSAVISERVAQTQPLFQIVASTDVVAREDVCPPQAAEQRLFASPASDPMEML